MISIIVPIYKVEKYIRQCVESIIAQSYRDLEIILVDDGSPDNCSKICDEYALKDERIKVIHKENGGLISARQAGLNAATGEYVCFVDGDDWLDSEMYTKIAHAIEETEADCVITQFYYAYENKNVKSEYKLSKPLYLREEIEKEIFPTILFDGVFYRFGIYPCCWTKVFKREILLKHLPEVDKRIRMGEDIAFTYPCIFECSSIAFIDEPLYYYRQNPESMTASYDSVLQDIYSLPYETLVRKSRELGGDLSNQLPYYLLYLTNFVIRNEANKANPKTKKESNEVIKSLISYKDLESSLSLIDNNKLPFHTKLLVSALKAKSVKAVNAYMALLRRTM